MTSMTQGFLGEADIERVAEYFEGSMESVHRFVGEVWLPDAVTTLQTIVREADGSTFPRVRFLCDHLREGARTVGAASVVEAADQILDAWLDQRARARTIASTCIASLCLFSTRLARAA